MTTLTSLFSRCKQHSMGLLALLFGLALLIRVFNLAGSSLWIDEIYSLMVVNTHPLPEKLAPTVQSAADFYQHFLAWQPMNCERLLALLKVNVHLPLYYLFLNSWLGWFGNNAVGLRSFSAVCSALLVFPLFGLGNALGGKRVGLLAAFLVAFLPFQIYYGQEGRMYAFTLLWTALSGLAFWKLLFGSDTSKAKWSLFYTVAVVAGSLSHYMFVFFLVSQILFLFATVLRNKKVSVLAWFIPAAIALVAVAWWWFPVYQIQQTGVNEDYHFAKGLVAWTRYLSVPIWQVLVVAGGDNPLQRVFYFPLLILGSLWYLWRVVSQKAESIQWQKQGFVWWWMMVPLLLQIAYDWLKASHISIIDRYAMLISPAVCLWMTLIFERWLLDLPQKRQIAWATGVLSGIFLMAIALVWPQSPFRDEHNKDDDIRGKIAYFVANRQAGDLIFVNGPFGAPNLTAYYLAPKLPKQPMIYWINRYRGQTVPLPVAETLKPYHRVWLFRHRANNERGLQTAKDYLQSHYPILRKEADWFIYSQK